MALGFFVSVSPSVSAASSFFDFVARPRAAGLAVPFAFDAAVLVFGAGAGLVTLALVLAFGFAASDAPLVALFGAMVASVSVDVLVFLMYLICAMIVVKVSYKVVKRVVCEESWCNGALMGCGCVLCVLKLLL